MAQSLVQTSAPLDKCGRVIGLFKMSSRGSLIGLHWSLALSALATPAIFGGLLALP